MHIHTYTHLHAYMHAYIPIYYLHSLLQRLILNREDVRALGVKKKEHVRCPLADTFY